VRGTTIAEDQLTVRPSRSGFGRSITGSSSPSAPFSLANLNSPFARGLPSAAAI
jgi:hypothetical protein